VRRRRLSSVIQIAAIGVLLYSVFGIFFAASVVYWGYDSAVLVSADGRTLTLGESSVPCFGTVAPVAFHDATRVVLLLRWTTTSDLDATCPGPIALASTLDVRLDAPLGTRTLVDGVTGHVLPRIDARTILHPRWPAGYSFFGAAPLVPVNGPGPVPHGFVQYFLSPSGGMVSLTQVLGPYVFDPLATQPIQIRGRPGWTDSRSEVIWSEDGQTVELAVVQRGVHGEQTPTVTELTAIADSAP
jgi:hypothetical protein